MVDLDAYERVGVEESDNLTAGDVGMASGRPGCLPVAAPCGLAPELDLSEVFVRRPFRRGPSGLGVWSLFGTGNSTRTNGIVVTSTIPRTCVTRHSIVTNTDSPEENSNWTPGSRVVANLHELLVATRTTEFDGTVAPAEMDSHFRSRTADAPPRASGEKKANATPKHKMVNKDFMSIESVANDRTHWRRANDDRNPDSALPRRAVKSPR